MCMDNEIKETNTEMVITETDKPAVINKRSSNKITSIMDEQIYQMFMNDGYSIGEIAKMLELTEESVVFSLSNKEKRELGCRYMYVVEKFNKSKDVAINTLIELSKRSESDAVKADCAKVILDYVSGGKEPKGLGVKDATVTDINKIIEEGKIAYIKAIGNKLGRAEAERVIENKANTVDTVENKVSGMDIPDKVVTETNETIDINNDINEKKDLNASNDTK